MPNAPNTAHAGWIYGLVNAPKRLKNSPINPENPGNPNDAKMAIPEIKVNRGIKLAMPE